jgi:ABC-type Mn2+/Zn2+ transport system ATPase subunit
LSQEAPPLLVVENAAIGYGRQIILPNVSLVFKRGSFTGLLGANGSGKSTLIKTILGILRPLGGRIEWMRIDGRDQVLGYTPQRDALDPIYLFSSFEVVLMGACRRVGPGRRFSQTEKDWAMECLRLSGADTLGRKLFSELSGGQKQRVLIARALTTKPDLLLLDEPTSGIDAAAREAVMETLRNLHEERNLAILMASHDLAMVRKYVHDVVWLRDGKAVHGRASELLSPRAIGNELRWIPCAKSSVPISCCAIPFT